MRLLPERRQHLRLVTLKNAAWLLGGVIVLFIAYSAWNELRPRDPSRQRLYERRSGDAAPAAAPAAAKSAEERPIADQTFTLRGRPNTLVPPPPTPASAPHVAAAERPRRVTLKAARRRGERIVITGGSEGVHVGTTPAPAAEGGTVVLPPNRF